MRYIWRLWTLDLEIKRFVIKRLPWFATFSNLNNHDKWMKGQWAFQVVPCSNCYSFLATKKVSLNCCTQQRFLLFFPVCLPSTFHCWQRHPAAGGLGPLWEGIGNNKKKPVQKEEIPFVNRRKSNKNWNGDP